MKNWISNDIYKTNQKYMNDIQPKVLYLSLIKYIFFIFLFFFYKYRSDMNFKFNKIIFWIDDIVTKEYKCIGDRCVVNACFVAKRFQNFSFVVLHPSDIRTGHTKLGFQRVKLWLKLLFMEKFNKFSLIFLALLCVVLGTNDKKGDKRGKKD